jgi:hypothetical protein
MKKQDYTTRINVNASPQKVFKGINSISHWWTEELEGSSQKVDDTFTVHFGKTYVTLKVAELIPGKKIVWHVTDCNKHWLKNKKEWKGTQVVWEISTKNKVTHVVFTHIGLVPELECYEACESAWTDYLHNSLKNLMANY